MKNTLTTKHLIFKAITALCSLAMCAGLAACGSDGGSSSSSSASPSTSGLNQLAGVTSTGKLGSEPSVSFHTPMTVEDGSYAVLQQGDGEVVTDGDRVCTQGIALNAKDGSELMNTWTKNTPDCSMVISQSTTSAEYYKILKGQKLNATIAFGINDANSSGTSYVLALTLISKSKALTRAQGDAVSDIPSNLPKVTLASDGKPSLNLNGYKSDGTLVAQTLITGKGSKVEDTNTVDAQYTGWVADASGKLSQFDSSWDSGQSTSFQLDQVVTGWKKGLTGKTVGSQVLLVIPPNEGYGDKERKDSNGKVTIPANSTLYFVVDILYAS